MINSEFDVIKTELIKNLAGKIKFDGDSIQFNIQEIIAGGRSCLKVTAEVKTPNTLLETSNTNAKYHVLEKANTIIQPFELFNTPISNIANRVAHNLNNELNIKNNYQKQSHNFSILNKTRHTNH